MVIRNEECNILETYNIRKLEPYKGKLTQRFTKIIVTTVVSIIQSRAITLWNNDTAQNIDWLVKFLWPSVL